ncbi:hypothetical protein [Caldisericum exile]
MGVASITVYMWELGLRRPSKIALLLLERIKKELEKKGGEKHGKRDLSKR